MVLKKALDKYCLFMFTGGKIKLPYCEQKNSYFCGPAVVQMVLAFYDIVISQATLARKMGTRPSSGTSHKELENIFKNYGFRIQSRNNGNLGLVKKYLLSRIPVIVNYTDTYGAGHYAAVIGFLGRSIILNDPVFGPNYKLKIRYFLKNWHGYHRNVNRRWLLAILKK